MQPCSLTRYRGSRSMTPRPLVPPWAGQDQTLNSCTCHRNPRRVSPTSGVGPGPTRVWLQTPIGGYQPWDCKDPSAHHARTHLTSQGKYQLSIPLSPGPTHQESNTVRIPWTQYNYQWTGTNPSTQAHPLVGGYRP